MSGRPYGSPVFVGLPRLGISVFWAGANFDEDASGLRQDHAAGVENLRFGPMSADLISDDAAFEAKLRVGRHRAQKLDFHMKGHRGTASRSYGLAHRFIEEGCDDAAVQNSGMAFECVRH